MTNSQSKYEYDKLSFDKVMAEIAKECHGKSTAEKRKIFTDMWENTNTSVISSTISVGGSGDKVL